MKKPHDVPVVPPVLGKRRVFTRLCALLLVLTLLFSAVPSALGEAYAETWLSLYFADATIEEGKSSGYAEQFFSNIAAISMADLSDQDFLSQLATAVDNGYKYRVFVIHQKGMPATDLAMLYCFQNTSWLMKNTTSMPQSVYLDASWEVLQGVNLKLKQKEILNKLMPDYDDFYECDAKYVWQIFMEFILFIEERNKALDQLMAGTTDQIPELPEEIEDWPLELQVSVQLPKELEVLDACFTVQPTAGAVASFDQVPESQRFEGVVGQDNLVTGTLLFWEAGPHRVHLVFTASLSGHRQSMSHEMSIDTSSVQVQAADACPVYGEAHQWRYEWAEEHPHPGRLVCDCGKTIEDPSGATRMMLDCCVCYGHEWALSYYALQGTGKAVGRCRRCGMYMDMTDRMPDYIRDYVNLLAEIGTEGNTYFEEHDTGKTPYLSDTAPWVYIADQALNRYTEAWTVGKETFVNTLAEPIVSTVQLLDGEYEEKINFASKTQMLWIQLIQEMMTGEEQAWSGEAVEDFAEGLDISIDLMGIAYDSDTVWLKSVADGTFQQSVSHLEEGLNGARQSLEIVRNSTTDPARILMEQDKVDQALKDLNAMKENGPDYSLANKGKYIAKSLPYLMNAISAVLEGGEAGEKVKEMRSAYLQMLNDYSHSRSVLDTMKADARARDNKDLERAVDSMLSILDTTYQSNLGTYFDATTRLIDAMGNELATPDETMVGTAVRSFAEKSFQTAVMDVVGSVFTGISPITIASTAAKILKGVANYDEIFDTSSELIALSSMRQKAGLSLLEYEDQVSPYTLALYAKLESEGTEKAVELVSTLTSEDDVDRVLKTTIDSLFIATTPTMLLGMMAADEMNVDVREFGIGNNEQETVVLLLQNEKNAYDAFTRECLRKAEKQ